MPEDSSGVEAMMEPARHGFESPKAHGTPQELAGSSSRQPDRVIQVGTRSVSTCAAALLRLRFRM